MAFTERAASLADYSLPGEAWLTRADLSQDGFDLVLTLDGVSHRVADYFSFDVPPNLLLESGPSLTPAMVKSLLPRAFGNDYLYAGPAAGPGLGEPIGTVSLLAGTVTVRRADGSTEALSRGDSVFKGDVLITGDGSFVKVRLTDGTTFQLGKNGEAALDDFEFNEAANIGNFEASIRVGGFYYKSGKIGEVTEGSADAHTKLSTPSSIIAVRGSELEGSVDSSGQTSVIHRSGILVITDQNGNNAVTLDQPGETAVVMEGSQPAFYPQAPANVIQQIQASVQPQTADEEVTQDESVEEAGDESGEEESSEEESGEEGEEEAEEEVTEETTEEAEEESDEEAEEDSEEAEEEGEEASEESEEEAAEEAAEDGEEESAEEGSDEVSEESAEEEAVEESQEESAEEESAEESQEEGSEEDSAEEESSEDESAEEGAEEDASEEASAEESADEESVEDASDEPSEDAADESSTEEGAESAEESGAEDAADETSDEESADSAGEEGAEESSDEVTDDASDSESAEDSSETAADDGSSEDAAEASAEDAQDSAEDTGDAAGDSADESGDGASSEEGGDTNAESSASEEAGDSVDAAAEGDSAEVAGAEGAADEAASGSGDSGADDAGTATSEGDAATGDSADGSASSAGESSGSEADSGAVESGTATTSDASDAEKAASAPAADEGSTTTSSDAQSTSTTTSDTSTNTSESASGQTTTSNTGVTEASNLASNTSEDQGATQGTTVAAPDSGTSTADQPVQPVIEQVQEEPPPDNPPIALDDSFTIASADAIDLGALVLANDSDPDENQSPTLTNIVAIEPLGALDLNEGQAIYTPDAELLLSLSEGETATEILEYSVESGGLQASASVELVYVGVNDAPEPQDDAFDVLSDESVSLDVLANDADPDNGAELTIVAVGESASANVSISDDGKSLVFTGVTAAVSEDTVAEITYTVSDGEITREAVLTLNITYAPEPQDDVFDVLSDESVSLDVLANDADPDNGAELTIVAVGESASANVSISDDGKSLVFTGVTAAVSEDTVAEITYTVSDGEITREAVLTLNITYANEAPVPANDAFTVNELTSSQLNVLANDVDPDAGDVLQIVSVSSDRTDSTVSVSADGTAINYQSGPLTGTANGIETLTYQVSDGELIETATATITITNVNNPPQSAPDSLQITEDETASIQALTNDSDADGDSLTISSVDTQTLAGQAVISADGQTINYTPPQSLSEGTLTETLSYTVSDGSLTSTNTVTITVQGINDPPEIVASTNSFSLDLAQILADGVTEVSIPLSAIVSDADAGSEFTVLALDDSQTLGTVTIGSVLYSPGSAFDFLKEGETTTEQFGVTVEDQFGAEASGTFVFTVVGVNDPPKANDDSFSVIANGQASGSGGSSVLANDTDVDADSLSITRIEIITPGSSVPAQITVGQPLIGLYGTLTLAADGSFSYDADQDPTLLLGANQTVSESFIVTVSDGSLTSTSNLSFSVAGVDDPTEFFGDTAFTIDREIPKQLYPIQGVLAGADFDTHATIEPVDRAAGSAGFGYFGYQPAAPDGTPTEGDEPLNQSPSSLSSLDAFESQDITPSIVAIQNGSGSYFVELNYDTTDNNGQLPGLAVRIHYDSSVISNVNVQSLAPDFFGASDQEDIDDLDFDPATDRYLLVTWADPDTPSWPGSLGNAVAELTFDADFSQSNLGWTSLRFTGDAADNYVFAGQSIQVYNHAAGSIERQIGSVIPGVWGYTPDPDAYEGLAHAEEVVDSYTFTASDGSNYTVAVTLVGENDPPEYTGSAVLTLDSGGFRALTPLELSSVDPDNADSEIVYTVVANQGGEIYINSLPVTSFTQADLNDSNNIVEFRSDSISMTSVPISIALTVEDNNEDQSTPESFVIRFLQSSSFSLQFVEDPGRITAVNTVAVISVATLLSNDIESNNESIFMSNFETTSQFGGTVSYNSVTNEFTYTPPTDFEGVDYIFYEISNEFGDVAGAYVTVEVSSSVNQTNPITGGASEKLGFIEADDGQLNPGVGEDALGTVVVSDVGVGGFSRPSHWSDIHVLDSVSPIALVSESTESELLLTDSVVDSAARAHESLVGTFLDETNEMSRGEDDGVGLDGVDDPSIDAFAERFVSGTLSNDLDVSPFLTGLTPSADSELPGESSWPLGGFLAGGAIAFFPSDLDNAPVRFSPPTDLNNLPAADASHDELPLSDVFSSDIETIDFSSIAYPETLAVTPTPPSESDWDLADLRSLKGMDQSWVETLLPTQTPTDGFT